MSESPDLRDGLYPHFPEEDYHAHPRISKHDLDRIAITPAHFIYSKLNRIQSDSAALIFGTHFHNAVLHPEMFKDTYAIKPKFDQRTKKGKEEATEWERENEGKTSVSQTEMDDLLGMVNSVRSHPTARQILRMLEKELTVFTHNLEVPVRSRIDAIGDSVVWDLKSAEKADLYHFAKDSANFRYHVQHAFYYDNLLTLGHKVEHFMFVVVEKKPPYAVIVYELDEESVEKGRELYTQDLKLYKECKEWDCWPAYSSQVQKLSLPRWALN
jgi:exodeoxyribonuclease VIII